MTLQGADALTENDVIDHVCHYLELCGYSILSRCHTSQSGDDIHAVREADGTHLFIEAKGATSSKPMTKRFGQPFDQSQAFAHVSEAAFRGLKTISRSQRDPADRAGIALPANELHMRLLDPATPAIRQVGIAVFWVHGDGSVTVESEWQVPA